MVDTLNLSCYSRDMGGINFIDQTTKYLNITGEHYNENGIYLSGSIGNLGLYIRDETLRINKGSLCKWHLGNNWQTMTREDITTAIENLSDILHLPMESAVVTRLDIAHNIDLEHPTSTYIEHLGTYHPYRRLPQPDGVLYAGAKRQLLFYDKLREQKHKREPIPEQYQDRHTLRIEQRYTSAPHKAFGVEVLRASDLYNEARYREIVQRWGDSYFGVKKINDVSINYDLMKGVKDMNLAGRLLFIEQMGGELNMLQQITEAQRRGEITKRQADELKRTTKATTRERANFTTRNEAITELDSKVLEVMNDP